MSLLSLTGASVTFGAQAVFQDVSVEVNPGDRIGLVGGNGAGKTTLLRVLDGSLEPHRGQRALARAARTALVEQVATAGDEQVTLLQAALSAVPEVLDLERRLEEAAHRLAGDDGHADQHYATLLNQFEARGGFGYSNRVEQVLTGVGFGPEEWPKPVAVLSGGQRGRLALARGLIAEPDVLLMDEPTNHLDLAGLTWLETFLTRWRGSLVITSHDRYFLDAVANQIWLLEDGRITTYQGNYTRFEQLRAAELEDLQRRYDAQQEQIAREEAFIRRYGAGQRAREARGRATRLARVERIEAPADRRSVNLKLHAARSGDIALTVSQLAVGYAGRTVVEVGKLQVLRGQRVAIIGPNGTGKSTLLRTLAGELPPVSGTIQLGSRVHIDLYHQEAENLDGEATVLEVVLATGRVDDQQARDFLGRFLFSGDDIDKRVRQLSGGERGRLAIARLVLSGANLLLLDEPTNHLDIASREALEDALAAYPGTLIFASHDRRLISALGSRVWLVGGGRLTEIDGGIEAYERSLRSRPVGQPDKTAAPPKRPASQPASRPPTRRLATVEAKIAALEAEVAELERKIGQASERGDAAAVGEVGSRFEAAQAELDQLLAEWAVLAEQV